MQIQTQREHEKVAEAGRQAARSAKRDALGELKCDGCGREVHGGDCPECDADDTDAAEDDTSDDGDRRRQDKHERLATYYQNRRDYQRHTNI
jgi:hypothetical protein